MNKTNLPKNSSNSRVKKLISYRSILHIYLKIVDIIATGVSELISKLLLS